MKQARILCAAILLCSSLAWAGCNDANDRSSTNRGAPGNPQGPSVPSEAQKNPAR